MTSRNTSKKEITKVLESASVYADRWPLEIRQELDVHDPLVTKVCESLEKGRSVLVSGNAGDGKTHLARRALDKSSQFNIVMPTSHQDVEDRSDTVLFLSDVSALSDADVLRIVDEANSKGIPLLICINEGPLNSLAEDQPDSIFSQARKTLHRRSRGFTDPDPEDFLILNLAGRQSARSNHFVTGVISKVLEYVTPCHSCGSSSSCPRVVGARLLKRSSTGRKRLADIFDLIASSRHMTPRDVWAVLIDLFFGAACPTDISEQGAAESYFWMRLFDKPLNMHSEVLDEFDPIHMAVARLDSRLWCGDYQDLHLDKNYPGAPPQNLAVNGDEDAAIEAFKSSKRFLFFFSKDWDPLRRLADETEVGQFNELIDAAYEKKAGAVGTIIGLINQYRLSTNTEQALWLSRHHSCAADRRPQTLAAFQQVLPEQLNIRLPFEWEAEQYPGSGFLAHEMLLNWSGQDEGELRLDFETWKTMREPRTITNDRSQEILDFAIDIFFARGQQHPASDPEMLIFDHAKSQSRNLRIRKKDRRIEIIK